MDELDINALLARADINALLARVDINALVEQIDMERIIDKLDINAIVARVDLDALVARTEIGSIIAATGAGIASKAIDVARSQGVGLDFFVQRWTDRLLRRRGLAAARRSGGADPGAGAGGAMSRYVAPDRDVGLQGPLRRHLHPFCRLPFRRAGRRVRLRRVSLRAAEYLVTTLSGHTVQGLRSARRVLVGPDSVGHLLLRLSGGGRRSNLRDGGDRLARGPPGREPGRRSGSPGPGPGPAPELPDAGHRVPAHSLPRTGGPFRI